MQRNSWRLLPILCLIGCESGPQKVYVNLDGLTARNRGFSTAAAMPQPPKPLPAETFNLPERPAQVLESSTSSEVVKPQADAASAQAEALKTIEKRLVRIYQKQIDFFASQQQALLGDPDTVRVQQVMPELRAAFTRYADARLPMAARLAYIAGLPDSNPKNLPPPANIRPVPKQRWLEANDLRKKVETLDANYSNEATRILGEAGRMAAEDRLAVLKKVEDFRRQMMDRALQEAINPLKFKKRDVSVRLKAEPQVTLPDQAGQSVRIEATNTLPPAPQVEFGRSGESETISRELLRRQLAIWAAINRYTVIQSPNASLRDATKDFERWRNQQRVGP
jgi:hypothetical protein